MANKGKKWKQWQTLFPWAPKLLWMVTAAMKLRLLLGLPCSLNGKESACNTGDPGSIPGSGRSSGEGNGNPLQYSCLENPMDSGTWQATVHRVTRVGHD